MNWTRSCAAALSLGSQAERKPPAPSGWAGSNFQLGSFSLFAEMNDRRLGTGRGARGRGAARQAFQNGVNTRNGLPSLVGINFGSNSDRPGNSRSSALRGTELGDVLLELGFPRL